MLLQRAGAALGVPATAVTLERLCGLVTPGAATAAMQRSAELRGLLSEIAREHGINRALMRQELTFLSHLTRLIGQEPEAGYGPPGRRTRQLRSHRPARLPRSGPPGLTPPTMPISSFYGMQTSLRGFWPSSACSTPPATTSRTPRPRATRARRPRSRPPPRCRSTVAGSSPRPAPTSAPASTSRASAASATSSWTRSTARQNTNLSDWTARADVARQRRALARRAGRERHQRSSSTKFWNVLVGPLQEPGRRRPPSRRSSSSANGADRLDPLRALADGRRAGRARRASTTRSPAPAARSPRSPPSSPA